MIEAAILLIVVGLTLSSVQVDQAYMVFREEMREMFK